MKIKLNKAFNKFKLFCNEYIQFARFRPPIDRYASMLLQHLILDRRKHHNGNTNNHALEPLLAVEVIE